MYAEERQQAMARAVASAGRLSVVDLAAEYDVTTETVRRDLSALERIGLVRRVHGGAVPVTALTSIEPGLAERDTERTEEKERIARAALELLPPAGATILLDAGSTTVRLAERLPRGQHLVAYTHAVPVAARLAANAGVDLHLLPGRVRAATQAAVGSVTVSAIEALRVDVAFVGANGVSVGHGLSTPDGEEAAVKSALVRAAQRVVVLADARKVGMESTVRFGDLDQVDVLVTDAELADDPRRELEAAGVEVVTA